MADDTEVRLKCIKEGNRLRVKIISGGYNPDANCQFPRDIREENREYSVPASDISLSEMRCKFFYRVNRQRIRIINNGAQTIETVPTDLKVYGEDNLSECCVCMMGPETDPSISFVIFAPCGHYCCCTGCAQQLKMCPMCRAEIKQLVTKSQLQ